MSNQCCAKIYSRYGVHTCSRTASVEEGGKWFCHQHSSAAKKARDEKRKARWRLESAAQSAVWDVDAKKRAVLRAACEAAEQGASWDDVAAAVGELRRAEEAHRQAMAALR